MDIIKVRTPSEFGNSVEEPFHNSGQVSKTENFYKCTAPTKYVHGMFRAVVQVLTSWCTILWETHCSDHVPLSNEGNR